MASKEKPRVISDLRFTSPEQFKGDSHRRPLALSREWAAAHRVTIDESLSDMGVSAFPGENSTTGALGTFRRLCKSGKIPAGSTLPVESLNRLSRQHVRKALTQFLAIIDAGITVVTLSDNRGAS